MTYDKQRLIADVIEDLDVILEEDAEDRADTSSNWTDSVRLFQRWKRDLERVLSTETP